MRKVATVDGLSFSDFESVSRAVLKFLHQRFELSLWMVTRKDGNDWIVLQSEDHGYNVTPGIVFRWADSFCSEMVQGHGPCIAPQSDLIPAYKAAAIGSQVEIKAYVGYPLRRRDGSLFGTLCGLDPHSQPASLVEEQALIQLLAKMLETLLDLELSAAENARHSERLQMESSTDVLTQLYNRRAWDRFLAAEEERCRRYGNPATVMIVDLDGLKYENDYRGHAAGDLLLQRTGQILRQVARKVDCVARLGGDEFGIISVECSLANAGKTLLERTRAALLAADIQASMGIAERSPAVGLKGAWDRADQLMYEDKRSRHPSSKP
ncbi:MAG: sensor domain-containing diguanylate cyclase [Phormidesmis sp.]